MCFANGNWQLERNEEIFFSQVLVESINSSIWCQDLEGKKWEFFAIPDLSCQQVGRQDTWKRSPAQHVAVQWFWALVLLI